MGGGAAVVTGCGAGVGAFVTVSPQQRPGRWPPPTRCLYNVATAFYRSACNRRQLYCLDLERWLLGNVCKEGEV